MNDVFHREHNWRMACYTGLIKSAVALVLVAGALVAVAHPYASGVTNSNGTISWVLNEAATDIKIVFDNGSVTNDLGAGPGVGRNMFPLGGHTNFAIVVYNVGNYALTQISSDANPNNNFHGPRGVAVNRNPRTGFFGRIYIANANPGTAGTRYTGKGIYALDAASGDCLGQAGTAALAGMYLGSSTTYSPYKLCLGPDDVLYVGDAGTGYIGGVWIMDPDLTNSANLFGLGSPNYNSPSGGLNFGRAIGTPNVTGSLWTGNLVLTLTAWDLNLDNGGVFLGTAMAYQNIYRYAIGGGPVPCTSYPTVVKNPIGIGNVNAVVMDAQIAPDGKYFITAHRNSPSDGTTNVCVLDSTGSTVLWDSRTQSQAYFGDAYNDHLCYDNYSIAVSPDDKYVLVQGQANNNFLMMSLTNGIPDISTLTTNTTVGAGGGLTCYASTWDAADNIYVTSGGSDTLRILSLGLTTTCITSNDVTCANGSFQFNSTPAVIVTQPTNQIGQCAGAASFSVGAAGLGLQYQWYLAGAGAVSGATNPVLALNGLSLAQSGAGYWVVVTNGAISLTSQVAVLTVMDTTPPVVTLNDSATNTLFQGSPFTDPGATAFDACAGSVPVITNGTVNVNVGGTYQVQYVATDPAGNSATNTRTVIVQATNGPPLIMQQPASQVAQCTSPLSFNVIVAGAGPLSYQWYHGPLPLSDGGGISGSSTATLTLADVLPAQAGDYAVVVTNNFNGSNSVTSQTATLSVSDTTLPGVTVLGSTVVSVIQGSVYTEAGAAASDPCVGSLPVTISGNLNVNVPGTYLLAYTATNATGQSASAQRVVTVTARPGPITAGPPNLVPLPATLVTNAGTFLLCPSQPYPAAPGQALMKILVDGASQPTGQYLAAALFRSTGYQFRLETSTATDAVRGAILITTANAVASLGGEGYELTVAPDSVVIRAPAPAGAFYGVQSLLQLLPPQIYSPRVVSGVAWVAPCVYIQDQPGFPWRGLMLDVARHFYTKDEVKQVLDAMAMHKLNTFHWHLTDDQGWRLEITNYPNLTTTGAFRAGTDYGLPPRTATATNAAGLYGGYYSQADAREVVAYAAERHITVVPEIELPMHVTAALASDPELGCGNPAVAYNMDYPNINYGVDLLSLGTPATVAFWHDVLDEVMGIFPGQYIHCGGDEVVNSTDKQWNSYLTDVTNMLALNITPNGNTSIMQYQYWFSTSVAAYLKSHGRTMIGWSEIDDWAPVTDAALMDWQIGSLSRAVTAAQAGQKVVMSTSSSCYVNYIEGDSTSLGYEPPFVVGGQPTYTTLSQTYAFNPVPVAPPWPYATNILGAQCILFGEYVPSFRNALFKLFPRASAMAEITWTPAGSQSFSSFTSRLPAHEQRFTAMGVNYDRETLPQIGGWGPTVPTGTVTNCYDITTNITAAGEVDVSFWYTGGATLGITSVELLVNGVQADIDTHAGTAEPYQGSAPYIPAFTLYMLHLPETQPGATYTIRTVTQAYGTSASGSIYLSNWN